VGEILKIVETHENVKGYYVTHVLGTWKWLLVEMTLKLLVRFVNFHNFVVLQFKVRCFQAAKIILSNI